MTKNRIIKKSKDNRLERVKEILKPIIWDYDIDSELLYEVLECKRDRIGTFNKEKIIIRTLERLSWYELLELLGKEEPGKNLTEDIIQKLRFKEMQDKYEFTRKILQEEAVSYTGWSARYRKKSRHTLLSKRWYRT